MDQIEIYLGRLTQLGTITCCVVLAGLLVWLAGLLIVIRGSKPSERPAIIRAYATCQPLMSILRRSPRPSARRKDSTGS